MIYWINNRFVIFDYCFFGLMTKPHAHTDTRGRVCDRLIYKDLIFKSFDKPNYDIVIAFLGYGPK